ncbi:G2/mitotic-specific cyclin-B3 [Patella vulgata]|uniref:G2/mitotic-specific cyclin-B3 n=1 Tax=Patella vulgata TaxID=6465 RepID=UPI0024A7C7AC|nr:G2/mitotic-specific cyclin-B3 [Patella vulgata]XP_050417994.2 G2/mitotic-specific cyclin-B3 [Patella vulgata]
MMNNSRKTRMGLGFENKKAKPSSDQSNVGNNNSLGLKRQGDNLSDPTMKRRPVCADLTNALKDLNTNSKIGLKKNTTIVKPTVKVNKDLKVKKSNIKKAEKTKISSSQDSSCTDDSSDVPLSQESQSVDISLVDFNKSEPEIIVPEGVDDIDKENYSDPVQCGNYAKEIFKYYMERESKFQLEPYMTQQPQLTSNMRSILVDWLVEVQENFELNHETLYLAVKLVDTYLSIKETPKEMLQLIGGTSLFIACKFDERCPPLIEDFLYICDDAYNRKEFLDMERNILKTIGFDLGMPLSYRFLRRFAKCVRAEMKTLTLARYILEMSLMDYSLISVRESKLAAAALHLARKMKKEGDWNKTLEYFSTYNGDELIPIVKKLNHCISHPSKHLTTILSKYSHQVFHEVAKLTPLDPEQL